MTMFTEGRLQAYERMMQQLPGYREQNWNKPDRVKKTAGSRKPAAKDGDRNGSDPGKKK